VAVAHSTTACTQQRNATQLGPRKQAMGDERGPSFPLVEPSIRPLFLVVATVAATSAGLEKSAIYIL